MPKKKNLIIGCIYRHPSSDMPIDEFLDIYLEPTLLKISNENKICILAGDFNVDLLKIDTHSSSNKFYNSMLSNFFAPYILQPTRPVSKTLIDNIFINTIDYNSISGNFKMQISDHLMQFTILEEFFSE